MKTLLKFVAFSGLLFLTSCQKEIIEEVTVLGKVMEVQVNFTPSNGYSALFEFPQNITVYESDVVLVYLLEDTINSVDVWTLLPQTFFTEYGSLMYTYNHTFYDVSMFLTANFNLDLASTAYTQNQVFRIAVIPAEYSLENPADLELVMNQLQISNSDIININNFD